MTDASLRQLEMDSRAGSWVDRLRYAAALERFGRSEEAVTVYGVVLKENESVESYSLARQGIFRVGLPWVEFDPPDAPHTVRFYNVMHRGSEDKERIPYVFTWDTALYAHPERSFEQDGMHFFTQECLAGILAKEMISKRPLTASAVHSHVLTLEDIVRYGLQPQEAVRARKFLREHLEAWPLTWTQIDCDTPGVIQDYDKQEQRDSIDIRGSDSYLRVLNAGETKEGDLVKQAVLRAEQLIEELDRMYNDLLGVQNGAYVWRPGRQARGRRAVVLGRSVVYGRFNIYCYDGINVDRPVRLVVAQSKKFPVETGVEK